MEDKQAEVFEKDVETQIQLENLAFFDSIFSHMLRGGLWHSGIICIWLWINTQCFLMNGLVMGFADDRKNV